MEEGQITSSGSYVKAAIAIIISLLVLGGLWAFLFKYYELYSQVSSNVNKNPMQQEAIDLTKLSVDYYDKSEEITSGYLSSGGILAMATCRRNRNQGQLAFLKVRQSKGQAFSNGFDVEEIDQLAQTIIQRRSPRN